MRILITKFSFLERVRESFISRIYMTMYNPAAPLRRHRRKFFKHAQFREILKEILCYKRMLRCYYYHTLVYPRAEGASEILLVNFNGDKYLR